MVIVDVQDKSIPEIICLPDLILDCRAHDLLTDDASYNDLLGTYQLSLESRQHISIPDEFIISHNGILIDGLVDGFCDGLTTHETIEKNINNCGIGSIQRTFEIRKADGQLFQTCIQNISFENTIDKESYIIDWPAEEVSLGECIDVEIVSNQIYGEPKLAKTISCSLFGTSYSDELFSVDTTTQSQLCYKVKRTWQVIDWCNQEDDYLNSLEFVQWIYVYQAETTSPYRSISGSIHVVSGAGMFDVNIDLIEHTTLNSYNTYTDLDGAYVFSDMASSSQYDIRPTYEDLAITGVSSFDLLLLQKHILGIESLNSPNELMAGDVNRDGALSSFDLVQMRSLILGQTIDWPNSTSWRFYDSSIDFESIDPLSPDVTDYITIDDNSVLDEFDFTAIKVGDISITKANEKSMKTSEGNIDVTIQDQHLKKGRQYDIIIDLANMTYSALQLGLIADPSKVQFVNSEIKDDQGHNSISNTTFKYLNTRLDQIGSHQVAFTIRVKEDILLSQAISIDDDFSKLWVSDFDLAQEMSLHFKDDIGAQDSITIHPNYPNPFRERTIIPINLSSAQVVTMSLMDAFGAILVKESYQLDSGDHTLSIRDDQLADSGIYYLTIGTSQQSVTKKLVFIKK